MKGLPPTLTLAVVGADRRPSATKATLSGVVSNHAAGEQVTIFYQPYPQPNPIQRATVLTTTGGTFSFIVAPQILTTYQAAWKGAYATPTTVQVQPKLTLGRNNGWIIHASGGRSFAGSAVQFQRLNTATGQWVTLQEGAAELEVVGDASLYTLPKGMNHLRRDDVRQPGGRRLPRRDRPDRQLAPDELTCAREARGELSFAARLVEAACRPRPS